MDLSNASVPTLGTILISELSFECIIGILPEERIKPQRLILSVEMDIDLGPAAMSDAVEQTVDYAAVSHALQTIVQDGRFWLLERLVVEACNLILSGYPEVSRVAITARKPDVLPEADYVGVRLEKHRD